MKNALMGAAGTVMMAFWITLIGVCCTGCAVEQPRTEIGAIGYVNEGFEKSVTFHGPMSLLLPDGNRLESPDGRLEITNDATKMFEAQIEARRMDHQLILGIISEVMPFARDLLMSQLTAPEVPATQPESSRWDRVADILDRIERRLGE